MWLSDTQKIGVGLTVFGILFMLLGIVMLFDGGLLAIGNLMFLCGLLLLIGLQKTYAFFARPQKLRGTVCFFGGIVLVFIRRPFIGMCVETFGFINLFGDFFPVAISFMRKLPIIGPVLNTPGIARIVDMVSGSKLPV